VSRTLSLVAVETEQPVAQPGAARGAKMLHYLRSAEGLALPAFFERWAQAHEHALAASPAAAAAVRRCAHNRQVPEFNAMLGYFSANDVPVYEGMASLWFDDAASVGAFRACERALLAVNAEAGGDLLPTGAVLLRLRHRSADLRAARSMTRRTGS
jgi:EthD domain